MMTKKKKFILLWIIACMGILLDGIIRRVSLSGNGRIHSLLDFSNR